jgi:rsbT co-antagonist protein RsbR
MRQALQWLLTIRSEDDDEQRRGYTTALISLAMIATIIMVLPLPLMARSPSTGLIVLSAALLGFITSLLLARSGRITAGALVAITVVLVGVLAPTLRSSGPSFALFFLSLSVLIASLTLRPWQIWLVLLANLAGVAVALSRYGAGVLSEFENQMLVGGSLALLFSIAIISFLGASALKTAVGALRQARGAVEATAAALARSNSDLESQVAERTAALQSALAEVQARAEEQARLFAENEQQRATIREMSVPVIPISNRIVVLPLIGALDTGRLAALRGQALQTIEQARVRYLVLDITGVIVVDSQVAQEILAVVQAARLLGTEVILVGIRPEVAQAIVVLGLNLVGIRTFSTLQAALNALSDRQTAAVFS